MVGVEPSADSGRLFSSMDDGGTGSSPAFVIAIRCWPADAARRSLVEKSLGVLKHFRAMHRQRGFAVPRLAWRRAC